MKTIATVWLAVCATLPMLSSCGSNGGNNPGSRLVVTDPATACQGISTTFKMSGTTVDAATYVASGFVPPGSTGAINQPFCRLEVTSRPSADSDIKSEVWMPAVTAWNGRFLAVGGSGNSGSIQYAAMGDGLAAGYAVLSTDNGHKGNEQTFAIGHPEKVIDFGHRAQAVTAVSGKALTKAFYEESAKKSYWLGCSQGGGKGMMQSQRYPDNFDGIVAGSPVFDWVGSQFAASWVAVKGMRDPAAFVPKAKLPVVRKAAMAACDGKDGLADGVIQRPERCEFNPAVLACAPGTDSNACLTPGQVASMQRYYSPVTRPDGRQIYAAYPPGSEGGSAWLGSTSPLGNWAGFWPHVVYENPAYSIVASLNVDSDVDYNFAKAKLAAHYDAVNTDLTAFNARQGKLMIWHGYDDFAVSAYHTRDYVDQVTSRHGTGTNNFMRAFFAPNVGHCGGSDGPQLDQMALLASMVEWVEKGVAPASVTATRRVGNVVERTMPVCAYPLVAKYRGTGDSKDAASFTCSAP